VVAVVFLVVVVFGGGGGDLSRCILPTYWFLCLRNMHSFFFSPLILSFLFFLPFGTCFHVHTRAWSWRRTTRPSTWSLPCTAKTAPRPSRKPTSSSSRAAAWYEKWRLDIKLFGVLVCVECWVCVGFWIPDLCAWECARMCFLLYLGRLNLLFLLFLICR